MEETAEPIPSFFDEDPADLIRSHRQYYLMVNAIARRVRQLQTGDRALALPSNGNREALYIAQEEFLQNKLQIIPRTAPSFQDFESDELPELDILLGMDDEGEDFSAADDED